MVSVIPRAEARCDRLASWPFSESQELLYRPYLSRAHREALTQTGLWMQEAGMEVRLDPAGNLIGRYEGTGHKTLLIASHIDSVRDGGAYDGPLGVMLGIEVVDALHTAGKRLPFAIEVMAFGDEEGSRFPASMLCSRTVAGQVTDGMLDLTDRDGISLESALTDFGLNRAQFLDARRDPADLIGYLEVHIEQGPVLEAENLALGVVTAIAAQRRYEVTVDGMAGHAGTNTMKLRRDALTAAAAMILTVEAVALKGVAEGRPDLVATVGRLTVEPNAPNVVPGRVNFTIDVRAGDEAVRDAAAKDILTDLRLIAARRDVTVSHRLIHDLAASPCDPDMTDLLATVMKVNGHYPRRLVSGAGHDAMAFSGITPTAMLFIRCKDGISHNPREAVWGPDVLAAQKVMLAFVEHLGARRD